MNDGVEDRVLCNPGNPQAFYTASDGFELYILLPSPPEYWDYRSVLQCLFSVCLFLKIKIFSLPGSGSACF